jgi:DNA-binding HxlR family transcriptional regulator
VTKPQTTSPARNVYAADCPTRQVLDQLANRWTVLILGILHEGPQRYGAMLRAAQGVSPRVLTRTLRDLERDGLVERRLLSAQPASRRVQPVRLGSSGMQTYLRPTCSKQSGWPTSTTGVRRSPPPAPSK